MWPVARVFCLAIPLTLAGTEPALERIQSIQLGLEANPAGLELLWSRSLRKTLAWRSPGESWASLEGGMVMALTPALGRVGLFGEWQPLPVLILRAEADQLRYTGQHGGVLSFERSSLPFGQPVLDARRGDEESASARRVQAQATLQYRAGPLVFRVPLNLVWTRNAGRGPWFYDPQYDTLLRDGDRLQDTSLQVGWAGGTGLGELVVGPSYEVTRTREAGLERRRAGLFGLLRRASPAGWLVEPYLAFQVGRDLRDPNRRGQINTQLALGGRF